tara:strand:- start:64 stop:822 length:759 start_codon:yes stop_codon:yes gene_type:complete
MYQINKLLERLARFCRWLISEKHKQHHKYHNKNQIINTNFILKSLKIKEFSPEFIVDVGCGHGEWTKKMIKYFKNSKYLLFDANNENKEKLEELIKDNVNIKYQISLLSDDNHSYKFYKMGYGSSIFEEQTSHKRTMEHIVSKKLYNELPKEIENFNNNMIKLDVQGSELKVLNGLGDLINKFEIIILETSIHKFNKNAPLFNEIISYMNNKNYSLYDLFDFKRIGYDKSFLIQFDCVFVRNNSKLLNVNFG